jgi:hypothetical protein
MKILVVISSLVLAATLSGCDVETEVETIQKRAAIVQACKDNGGEWYHDPIKSIGARCHFDTRYDFLEKDK